MPTEHDIDVSLLRAFVAVAETGRMTRAAKVVHVTQSAVSQRILRLEALLEIRLFERQSGAARLTKDGERFMSRARRLIALNDEILSDMRGGDFAGEIKLGVPHDVVASVLPPMLREFRYVWPNVLVTLVSSNSTVLRTLLDEHKLDAALTTELERAGRRDCLLSDHLVWVGAVGGSAAQRRPLSVALGQKGCAFRASAVDALDKTNIPWRPICQVGSLEPVFATVEADMAIAPFLRKTVPERLEILDVQELPALPTFHINLRFPGGPISSPAQSLVDHIRAGFRSRYA
jgi:DNA-binding transcriptional LysR family regulator